MTKKARGSTEMEFFRWTEEDLEAIKQAWDQGHYTPAAIRDASGLNIDLAKIKSKIQALQRGDNPVLVKKQTPGKC